MGAWGCALAYLQVVPGAVLPPLEDAAWHTPGGAFGSRLGGVLHGEKRGFRSVSLI